MVSNLFDDESLHDVPPNPYVFGQVLSAPPRFVDRTGELRHLITSLRQDRSGVLLLRGDFRIGKTSILRNLQREVEQASETQRVDRDGRRIECHAFTCERLLFGRPGSILAHLCALLGAPRPEETDNEVAAFLAVLEKAEGEQRHPVFLVDEVGALPQVAGARTFVRLLRSIVADHPVHFVLCGPFALQETRMGWADATDDDEDTQALHGDLDRLDQIVKTVQVGPFGIGAAVELIRLSETLFGTGRRSDDVRADATPGQRFSLRGYEEIVLDLAGTIPYVIQVACAKLYEILYEDPQHRLQAEEADRRLLYLARTPRDVRQGETSAGYVEGEGHPLGDERLDLLKQRVYSQLADAYFDPLWHDLLDNGERRTLLEIEAGLHSDQVSWKSPAFHLKQRGYLRERGDRLWIFSSLFEEYIDRNHRDRVTVARPTQLQLQLGDSTADAIGRAGVVPMSFRKSLEELSQRCATLEDGEPSLEDAQDYVELLAHLLAFLSQVAVVAYAAQPGMHKPELNNMLRQRRHRSQSLGMRLEHLRTILAIDRLHDDDILAQLKASLCRRRDEDEIPANVLHLYREVTGRHKTRSSLLDFLEACVQLRNLQTHPEDRPAGVSVEQISRLIPVAAAGLHELVSRLVEESGGHTVVALAEGQGGAGTDAAAPDAVPVTTVFADRRSTTVTSLRSRSDQAVQPSLGEMYPATFDLERDRRTLTLQISSLCPLIIEGEALRKACADPEAEIQPDAVYVLIGTRHNGLRFAPLGQPRGDRIEIRPTSTGGSLLDRYDELFDGLR